MSNKVNNVPQHKTIPATPATPNTGFGKIYIKTDRLWYGLDDLGVETPLSGGGSGGGITLTSLSANAPITYNNLTGVFNMGQSSGSTSGFLSSTDWTIFNNKQGAITLTTTGSSGAATLIGNTLNIPQYSGGGSGGASGSGTTNYLTKWTPDGTTLGDSQIQDDGTVMWINQYSSNIRFNVTNSSASIVYAGGFDSTRPGGGVGLNVLGRSTNGLGNTRSILSQANGGVNNTGIETLAGGTGTKNIGVYCGAWGASQNIGSYISAYGNTGTKIGAQIIADGTGTRYSVQLTDGTEGAGKFLKCITSDGKSNWSNITSSDISGGASGTFTSNDGKTITVTNGLITSIV